MTASSETKDHLAHCFQQWLCVNVCFRSRASAFGSSVDVVGCLL